MATKTMSAAVKDKLVESVGAHTRAVDELERTRAALAAEEAAALAELKAAEEEWRAWEAPARRLRAAQKRLEDLTGKSVKATANAEDAVTRAVPDRLRRALETVNEQHAALRALSPPALAMPDVVEKFWQRVRERHVSLQAARQQLTAATLRTFASERELKEFIAETMDAISD
jgi:hypothetical protein